MKRKLIPNGRAPYRRGYALEMRVKKRLEAAGWTVVRSPQSRGDFDLMAVLNGRCALIQCKRGGQCSPAERIKLEERRRQMKGAEAYVLRADYSVRAVDDWARGWEAFDVCL